MSEQDVLVPVILSGGTGSRLWPISRESHPKPFIALPDGQSLLQKTFQRASGIAKTKEIITITNKEYYLKSKAEYEKSGHPPHLTLHYLLEPFARNTAGAIAFAALRAEVAYGDDAILVVLPADHLIENLPSFYHSCAKAIALARANKLVTFGINPTLPETGYGYIECGQLLADHDYCYDVASFVEKPPAPVAAAFLRSGRYLWNSGMFCFKASTFLAQLALHAPALLAKVKACWERSHVNASIVELDPDSFAALPNISIDYALMEKTRDIAVVACDYDWQDIGSWEAYKKLYKADGNGNTVLGEAVLIDSRNNFIHSHHRMIASIGIDNLAIIDTPDALLITPRDRAQEVKDVVQTLKNQAHESYLTHRTVIRPWGSYTVLEEGPSFKIKRIVVKPQASLSLQQHEHRSEHWVVIAGTASIINGDKEQLLVRNQSTFVPSGTKHRLSNPGTTDLIIIEVQTGNYLGEDDIVRFEDSYGRIS